MAVSPTRMGAVFHGLPRMTPNEQRRTSWCDRWMDARWGWKVGRSGRRTGGIDSPLLICTDRRNARGRGAPRNRASRSVTGCASPNSSSVMNCPLPELDRTTGDAR